MPESHDMGSWAARLLIEIVVSLCPTLFGYFMPPFKGCHFEHNYGHGRQPLSSLLASLIIPAFLTHTVLEWMDDKHRPLRKKLPSRERLFTRKARRCMVRLLGDGWRGWG